ncbi:hypothetical protein B0H19DRAFT_1275785 [Mycena capillaripes]|nr:hypothetical protein B0H19DRAFT_1275785 [Mycena capillaripes]
MSLNDDCGLQEDSQLLSNTMAGLVNVPFTFECSGVFGIKQQPGPSFRECGSTIFEGYQNTDFCIGGLGQQHACTVGTCQVIDWTAAVAPPCSSTIMDYVRAQPNGLASPCCNSDACLVPDTPYTCDVSRALQLCVVDGSAAQCLDPATNEVCSGNYTAAVGPSGSRTPNGGGSSNSAATFGGSPGPSTDTIAIASSLAGTIASLLTIVSLLYAFNKKSRKWMQNKKQKIWSQSSDPEKALQTNLAGPYSWSASSQK